MARPREVNDDADAAALPLGELAATADEDPYTAEMHACYDEYLRMLDEVPVLYDVVSEPPRVRIRDFVRGERPDARKEPREDPYVVRGRLADELEQRYREYEAVLAGVAPVPVSVRAVRSKASKKKSKRKPPRRAKRRKR